MSKRAYVKVRDGEVVSIARPLQGSLVVYGEGGRPLSDSMMAPVVDYPRWPGDGVWLAGLTFRRLKAHVSGTPKRVNVPRKIAQMEKKLGVAGNWGARTGSPGIQGFQQRANAAGAAAKNRQREAVGLLGWLKGLKESAMDLGEAREVVEGALSESVAQTILQQIRHGMGGLNYAGMGIKRGSVFSLGADAKIADALDSRGPGVQFDVRGHWKGRVIVRLDPSDTYTVIFGRVRSYKWKIDKRLDGIYADQLGKVVWENVLGTGIRK